MVSIRALLIHELGFDPDEPVVAELRSKVIANAAEPSSLAGALAGAMPHAPELRALRERDRLVALRRSKDSPIGLGGLGGLGNVAEVAAQLGIECVAPAHLDGQPVAVVRTATGRLHVLPDRCPHDGGTLSDGYVDGELIVCARHGWEIEACSGRCGRAPEETAPLAAGSGPIAAAAPSPPAAPLRFLPSPT